MVKIKGIEVEMGGTVRIVPPLNLGALSTLQDRLSKFSGGLDKESVELVIDAAFLSLKRNYPEITIEMVQDEIDVSNMDEIFKAIMDVSGLHRKAAEAEKGEALGTNQ
jgi:hypothetical protein